MPDAVSAEGGARLPKDADEAARLEALAALWPGLDWTGRALSLPGAAVLDPAAVLAALAGDAPRIVARVTHIAREDDVWSLLGEDGRRIAAAPALVLAGGAGMASLDLAAPLGLRLSAGQVGLHAAARPPDMLSTWGGFAAPAGEGAMMVGATHDATQTPAPPAPDPARARTLAEAAAGRLPEAGIDPEPESVWTGVRAAPADRLPCAGPLPDGAAYGQAFAGAAKGAPDAGHDQGRAFPPGLYALSGLGSRGFAHAPLLAEAVAAEICGEPAVLEASARRALHPARFVWRALKRG